MIVFIDNKPIMLMINICKQAKKKPDYKQLCQNVILETNNTWEATAAMFLDKMELKVDSKSKI